MYGTFPMKVIRVDITKSVSSIAFILPFQQSPARVYRRHFVHSMEIFQSLSRKFFFVRVVASSFPEGLAELERWAFSWTGMKARYHHGTCKKSAEKGTALSIS
jgi:hypothetical protein